MDRHCHAHVTDTTQGRMVSGELFICVMLSLRGNRGSPSAFKVEENDQRIRFEPVGVGEPD